MSGAALVSVQRLLGHSDPKMTERRYGHLLPDFMASEVNRLRFGLGRLAPRPLGTSLVQSADPGNTEAGTPASPLGIPASLLAGCRGLEPLASGVTVSEITLGGGGRGSQAGGNTGGGSDEESSGSPGFAGVLRPLGIPLVSRERGAAAGLERLLTVREVAAVLGVATSTVYQLCAAGKLRHCRVSNAIRCAPTDVAVFVRDREHGKGT
jgi:excisionase family DNA binding protein